MRDLTNCAGVGWGGVGWGGVADCVLLRVLFASTRVISHGTKQTTGSTGGIRLCVQVLKKKRKERDAKLKSM